MSFPIEEQMEQTAPKMEQTAPKSFTIGQTWGALRKSWKGYKIAKVQDDRAKMMEYATKIRKLQGELGVQQASFPDLALN